jgi:UDP-glucose 4-epimerase
MTLTDERSIAGSTVLVTGGAGFVGARAAKRLAACNCRNIILVDSMVRGRRENLVDLPHSAPVCLIEQDIRSHETMRRLLEGVDIVLHLAALRITHCAAEPRAALEVMADATFDLLEQCVRQKVKKFVFASSASVYGMAEAFPTTEQHDPYANRTLYGAAKLFGEGLLRSFNDMYGLNYIALRYFNVYGPGMDINGKYTEVLIRWMERIEAGAPPVIFGDGLQTMDLVHVDDVARATVLAAASDATDVVMNVGTGTETSLLELAGRLAKAMGQNNLVPVHVGDNPVNPVRRRVADINAARRLLGFGATISLDDGLRDLVAWWRSQRSSVAIGAAA